MRKVVVNTTPLIALSGIHRLELLRDLYHEIYIPKAVLEEAKDEPAYSLVRNNQEWIHVVEVPENEQRKMFQARLHAGEVEVMLYAMESKADLVILDDMLARNTAKYLGLTITGTMGVILKAKEKGLISQVKPVMDDLISDGLYVSDILRNMVLKCAGEGE